MDNGENAVPNVLIFPLPLQSPVNSMLKLSELLCLAGVHVTFLNTEHNHRRLLGSTDAGSRFERYPGKLSFEVISDGLREDHPRSAEDFEGMVKSLQGVAEAHLREMLGPERGRKVTCVIAEGMFDYAFEIGKEVGVPVFAFETVSPCYLGVCLCIPKLLAAKEVLDENLVRELKKGCLECGHIVSWALKKRSWPIQQSGDFGRTVDGIRLWKVLWPESP
nr:7-deoxyloganetic acid glucosyltransferase-like [Ipomoea batatas]